MYLEVLFLLLHLHSLETSALGLDSGLPSPYTSLSLHVTLPYCNLFAQAPFLPHQSLKILSFGVFRIPSALRKPLLAFPHSPPFIFDHCRHAPICSSTLHRKSVSHHTFLRSRVGQQKPRKKAPIYQRQDHNTPNHPNHSKPR